MGQTTYFFTSPLEIYTNSHRVWIVR